MGWVEKTRVRHVGGEPGQSGGLGDDAVSSIDFDL